MAIYNAIQERGLNRVLQQRLTMLDAAPAPALVPEIGANLVLESDRPEWRRWKSEIYFGWRGVVAAVAGEWGSAFIAAPNNSVIVIEQLYNSSAQDVQVGWRAAAPAYAAPALANPYARDNSVNAVPLSAAAVMGTLNAIPQFSNGNEAHNDRVNAGVVSAYPIVLWPRGEGLLIRGISIATEFRFLLRGYTRTLLPNELG